MDNIIQIFTPSEHSDLMVGTEPNNKKASTAATLLEPRASHYTIYVDLPDNDEEMILVHGFLGHRVLVSKQAANYLRSLESKSPPRPLYGTWSEPNYRDEKVEKPDEHSLKVLKQKGFLTRRSYEQELEFFKQYVAIRAKKATRKMPSYLFMPTYDCNLRCHYCFQDHMRKDPNFKPYLKLMDKSTVDAVFAAMPDIEEKHGYEKTEQKHRDIAFFGGEPLLQQNREIVEYIMAKARELGTASFSAISNATELHHYKDLLGPEGINEIQITLDGTPEEHDKRRIYPDGSGSFAAIARNITMALEQKVWISVRLNIDANNIHDLPALAQIIKDYKWDQYSNFLVYLAPIRAGNDDMDADVCMTTRKLDNAMKEMKMRFPITRMFSIDAEQMRQKAEVAFAKPEKQRTGLKTQYCAAHSKMYLFDAQNDIYACWEKTGDKSIRIGSVNKYSGLKLYKDEEARWRSRTVASNPVCAQCRYAMNCGGGCAILAEERTGELHSNFCDSYGKRFRTSVAEAFINSQTQAQEA